MGLGGKSVTRSLLAVFVRDGPVRLWRHRGKTHKISRGVRDNFFSVPVKNMAVCIFYREGSSIPFPVSVGGDISRREPIAGVG